MAQDSKGIAFNNRALPNDGGPAAKFEFAAKQSVPVNAKKKKKHHGGQMPPAFQAALAKRIANSKK